MFDQYAFNIALGFLLSKCYDYFSDSKKMETKIQLTLVCLAFISVGCYPTTAARILFVPKQHYSNFNALLQVGQALVDDGHKVWILTQDDMENFLPKDCAVKPLLFSVSDDAKVEPRLEELMSLTPIRQGLMEQLFKERFHSFGLFCDEMLQNMELMKEVENKHFDIAIMDYVEEYVCMYMLPYIFGIPYITYTSDQTASWYAGVTGLPSIEPELRTPFSNQMSFWQRFQNLHVWLSLETNIFSDAFSEPHMKRYATHRPHITYFKLLRNSEMFLINREIMCLDYPRVSAPNYQFLGGVSSKPAQPLSENLEKFVEGAEHGIVIMSLGSHRASQMVWKILRKKLFKAMGQLPQQVIVQYSLNEHVNIPGNVKLMEWIPQNDLLAHPKTKLFITHGGNNGQNEAMYHGIPVLVVPLFFDQYSAGVKAKTRGYGDYVRDIEAVKSEKLYEMMSCIINNASYSLNTKRCSKIIKSMPSPKEIFVFWVNHILAFGGSHLKPPSLEMPLYQVLMLDIVAFYTCLIIGCFYVLCVSLIIMYLWLSRMFKSW